MPLSVAEIRSHPAFKDPETYLEPTSKGDVPVATSRDGPVNLSYEIHGHGPIKLVWVMGLNAVKFAWHRQTRYFGHENGEKYTCLIWDNRGVGHSHRPSVRYSTSGMAHDLYELLEHLGWTEEDSLHVIGVSMGGMIAQEFAYAHPTLIASLSLLSTASRLKIFSISPLKRLYMFLPKSFMARMRSVQSSIFAARWISSPDTASYATTHFPTNGDRFVAEELWKMDTQPAPSTVGMVMQAMAATFHHMPATKLAELRRKLVGKRVLVVHGEEDAMISRDHADDMLAGLGGVGRKEGEAEVVFWGVEGVGHCVMVEMPREFNGVVERFVNGEELKELPDSPLL
ncbi:alpha/beta-hydrolase [Ascobolus immersus RN42]|uniref:Alpha/beta-hydrolase n=1 Tax=Ascobolus immersus RN42 TaxID=1160509 RepID=A0A3N4INY0_ASCIM|nr:alpha/beta-hydrolase [Ascobolus immersus RN42]